MRSPPPTESGRSLESPLIGLAQPLTRYLRSLIRQRIGWDRWPNRPPIGSARSPTTLPNDWHPLAHSAADRIAPLTNQAIDRVSPYAQQAVSKVSPYAHQAAERIGPMASTAKQQGARVAHDALEKIAPVLDEALEKVSPAVEAARGKVSDDILPKLSEVLSAAAGTPVVVEATKRGKAAVAAAKGELELPEEKKKSRWVMRIAVVAAIAGAAVFVIRRFLGSRDADWQAARPTTPYAPPRPAETSQSAESAATAAAPTVDGADAGDDPQGGLSAHLVNLEADGAAVPDQPAEGGDVEAPAEAITEIEESLFETSVGEETPTEAAPEPEIAEPVMADDAAEVRSRGGSRRCLRQRGHRGSRCRHGEPAVPG